MVQNVDLRQLPEFRIFASYLVNTKEGNKLIDEVLSNTKNEVKIIRK